jgi:hypothetical protein
MNNLFDFLSVKPKPKNGRQISKATNPRLPLIRPNLRVDMVGFCAILSAVLLPIVVLLQLVSMGLINGKSISFFTLPDGSTKLAQIKPSDYRTTETIEDFVIATAKNITSWNIQDEAATVTLKGKKFPAISFYSFFVFDEKIRMPLMEELASQIPESVITGKVTTTLKVSYVKTQKLSEGHWKVSLVGHIIPNIRGTADGISVPYNQNFYLSALTDIPAIPTAQPKDQKYKTDDFFAKAVTTVTMARLSVVKLEAMEPEEVSEMTGGKVQNSAATKNKASPPPSLSENISPKPSPSGIPEKPIETSPAKN